MWWERTVHAIASQPEYCVLFNAYDILCNKIERARTKIILEWSWLINGKMPLSCIIPSKLEMHAPVSISRVLQYSKHLIIYCPSQVEALQLHLKIRWTSNARILQKCACHRAHASGLPSRQKSLNWKSHASPSSQSDTKRHWIQATWIRAPREASLSKVERLLFSWWYEKFQMRFGLYAEPVFSWKGTKTKQPPQQQPTTYTVTQNNPPFASNGCV